MGLRAKWSHLWTINHPSRLTECVIVLKASVLTALCLIITYQDGNQSAIEYFLFLFQAGSGMARNPELRYFRIDSLNLRSISLDLTRLDSRRNGSERKRKSNPDGLASDWPTDLTVFD